MKLLFVCTGNICRSPTAEGVMRHLVNADSSLANVVIDSAGTTGYHVGEAPDRRSQAHARKRGYNLSELRARQVLASDFTTFDLLLAMDKGHYQQLQRAAPEEAKDKVVLFLEYTNAEDAREVPDPYYGGEEEFEAVLDLIEAGCYALLDEIKQKMAE